jgi:hypothetical protein
MNKHIFLVAIFMISGCNFGPISDADEPPSDGSNKANKKKESLKVSFDTHAKRDIAAIQSGKQGCAGNVLKREDLLKNIVNDKLHWNPGHQSGTVFHSDGRLIEFENHQWDQRKRKIVDRTYYIDKYDRVCTVYSKYEIHCSRYVRLKNDISVEFSPYSVSPCLVIDIDDVGSQK